MHWIAEVDRVVLNALVKVTTVLPPDIRAFGDSMCDRSEPDWHFQEKPIHLWPKGLDPTFISLGCHGEQTVVASYQLITAASGEGAGSDAAWESLVAWQ